MKLLNLLIIASVVALATAAVVKAPVKQKAKMPIVEKRQEDEEGVDVDPVITVSNIEVVEITAAPPTTAVAPTSSSEEYNSVSSEVATASEELETDAPVNVDDAPPLNRYCKCSSYECKCCRDFSLPLVPISGPGCATIRYLENDRMSVGIKFGNRVLASRVISARQETPICLPLPGGFSNFCGRIYGIGREKDDFKACLGLELRADDELEAALRVSCFKFGERGLRVTEAEPLPVPTTNADEDEDDDDDLFGFGGGDDDDDDDDPLGFADATEDDDDTDDDDDETPAASSSSSADSDDDVDYTGFSLLTGDLLEDFLEDDDDTPDKPAPIANRKVVKNKKNKNKGTLKKPQEVIDSALPAQNEVDSTLNNDKVTVVNTETAITAESPETSVEEDEDDDDDEEEEDEDGILSLVSTFLSDDDEDEDDEDEDDDEEEEIETESTLNAGEEEGATKDEVNEDEDEEEEEDDLDEAADEVSAEAVADEIADDDDDEDEYDDTTESYKEQKKPSSFSILGLRNFLSKLRRTSFLNDVN